MSRGSRLARAVVVLSLAATSTTSPRASRAEAPPAPDAAPLPAYLGLEQARSLFRARGLDRQIAELVVESARGDLEAAGAIASPAASVGIGPALDYSSAAPCSGCTKLAITWAVDDEGALADAVVGKRGLRLRVATAALEAARLGADDVRRVLESQLVQTYVGVAVAAAARRTAEELAASTRATLAAARLRYPAVLDEGGLARVEAQALEADQAVVGAEQALRQARVALALLLGSRGTAASFEVEPVLDRLPTVALPSLDEGRLRARALASRPDLAAAGWQRARAEAALAAASRARVPDVALGLAFSSVSAGQQGASPANVGATLSTSLPVFYQQQGEIARARADRAARAALAAKSAAAVAADVSSAYAAFTTARAIVERLEGSLLERARVARDRTDDRFRAGAVPLTDLLDALRSYAAVRFEHVAARGALWAAYYQLEQAVGGPLS